MKRVFYLALFVAVGGCQQEKSQKYVLCSMEALNLNFKNSEPGKTYRDIDQCMILNGYEKQSSPKCPQVPLGSTPSACYQPKDWFDRTLSRIEDWRILN